MQNYPDLDPFTRTHHLCDTVSQIPVNKYVYFKHNFIAAAQPQVVVNSKVLVNPHFNKKVFINPNYHLSTKDTSVKTSKIHINPRIQSIKPPDSTRIKKILLNPEVLRNVPTNAGNRAVRSTVELMREVPETVNVGSIEKAFISKEAPIPARKRRLSVRSKFKIVRSHSKCKENDKKDIGSLTRVCSGRYEPSFKKLRAGNKFKLDNRKKSTIILKKTKYYFDNKFSSLGDVAKRLHTKINKTKKMKSPNLLNIGGTFYKNSPNSLRRTSAFLSKSKQNILKIQNKPISKSKYRYIKRTSLSKTSYVVEKKTPVKLYKRSLKLRKSISVEKLRKCNIPCPYYQKFGRCKRKDLGKCNRKHDPDQIALCTKFLQGACIDDNCLLSHNVSPEKMPTCKFYLEGSCSRDQCPYVHVRISPKADICKDFLEGFCRKAIECDKRHQFLCPEYEKKGCSKPRCPYPHGKMVRKYSVFNKHKFAKKSSNDVQEKICENPTENKKITKLFHAENTKTEKGRYYLEDKGGNVEKSDEIKSCASSEAISDQEITFRSRPKLGELPSFIAFEEKL
ncbi:hypothetical protein JTB14_023379 [Gonioctena quinquepunctata]|nr:hypothetical protein JTB14_023379 [Gonioctena quinquepunctata]